MLTFQELRITPDNKYLIIDVEVDADDLLDKVEIDSIVIDTQDTFVANGPSSKPVYTYHTESEYDNIYVLPERCNCNPVLEEDSLAYCFVDEKRVVKNVRLFLNTKDLGVSLDNNMFFVYAIAKGYPAPDTPCGRDNSQILGTVINLYPFYQDTIGYLKELNDTCTPPKNFIDSILRFKALELSIKTGNYTQAIKYWKQFFSKRKPVTVKNNCGCYG